MISKRIIDVPGLLLASAGVAVIAVVAIDDSREATFALKSTSQKSSEKKI